MTIHMLKTKDTITRPDVDYPMMERSAEKLTWLALIDGVLSNAVYTDCVKTPKSK
jgi:hypothetical protein